MNNLRHQTLFAALADQVQVYRVPLSRRRLLRGAQFRLWRATNRALIYPAALAWLSERYQYLFTTDAGQVPYWPRHHSVIVDMDDPVFTDDEITRLALPQVRALVVTNERARTRYRQAGIDVPIEVIPQPVDTSTACREHVRHQGDIVVGYHAPTLSLRSDGPGRPRQGLDDLDLLIDAMRLARTSEPALTLCLVGAPTAGLRSLARTLPWIHLVGQVAADDVRDYVSTFDIGSYPRMHDVLRGRSSIKVAQFMAAGIPIVATDVDEAAEVIQAGAGLLCSTSTDLAQALVELARSPALRERYGQSGRDYAVRNLDRGIVMRRYRDVLTRWREPADPSTEQRHLMRKKVESP